MEWNENFTTLNYLLADLYYDKDESRSVAIRAGLKTGNIAFKEQPYTNWFNILDASIKQGKYIALLDTIMLSNEKGGSADVAIQQTILALKENIVTNKAPVTNVQPVAKKPEETPGDLEKIMGNKSTLLPISFLEKGLKCAKSVVRIDAGQGLGSGFMVDKNWVVTNNHVIPDEATARQAIFQFNYQKNLVGLDLPFEDFSMEAGAGNFFTNEGDDWSLIKLAGDPVAKFGKVELSDEPAKKDDFVNIIQHPSGGPKQIALYHNTVTSTDDKYVLYLTDTLPGSSGSPVFNTDWKVVALHHWGGTTKEAYTNLNVYRNRGIQIGIIKKAIRDLGISA